MKKYMFVLFFISMNAMAIQNSMISDPIPIESIGATEITQLSNHVELVAQLDQLVQQLSTVKDQLTNMLNNSNPLVMFQSTDISKDLSQLLELSQKGESISFTEENIDSQFDTKYPGYTNDEEVKDFSAAYKEWSDSSMDGLKKLIQTTKQQSDDFQEEDNTLNNLRDSSQFSTGRMQALQVGNEIATEQVKQMEKLRELMMSQSQAQYSYMASERSEKDTDETQVESLLKKHMRLDPNYQHFQE